MARRAVYHYDVANPNEHEDYETPLAGDYMAVGLSRPPNTALRVAAWVLFFIVVAVCLAALTTCSDAVYAAEPCPDNAPTVDELLAGLKSVPTIGILSDTPLPGKNADRAILWSNTSTDPQQEGIWLGLAENGCMVGPPHAIDDIGVVQ